MLVLAASQSHMPHIQSLAASNGSRRTDTQYCVCKQRLTENGHSTGVVSTGFCFVGFHVGFQLSGYGGGHHGKGTVGVHVGVHVGFQLLGYGGGYDGKGTVGVYVGFHVGFQLSG